MEWFGFWIFLAVFVACDYWIFSQGYNSFFQDHKTDAEKELQRLKLEERRRKVEAYNAPDQADAEQKNGD